MLEKVLQLSTPSKNNFCSWFLEVFLGQVFYDSRLYAGSLWTNWFPTLDLHASWHLTEQFTTLCQCKVTYQRRGPHTCCLSPFWCTWDSLTRRTFHVSWSLSGANTALSAQHPLPSRPSRAYTYRTQPQSPDFMTIKENPWICWCPSERSMLTRGNSKTKELIRSAFTSTLSARTRGERPFV